MSKPNPVPFTDGEVKLAVDLSISLSKVLRAATWHAAEVRVNQKDARVILHLLQAIAGATS